MVSGIAEGLRFVWNLRVLRTLGMIDLTVTALYLPMESVLFPKYFTDHQQPVQLGWALMAIAAAAWWERWGMPCWLSAFPVA